MAPRPGLIVALSLALTVVAATVIGARWNINSDFKALLPSEAPAAQAMDEVNRRIGGGSSLFVVIDSPDEDANLEFARAYSERLLAVDGVALAHYHNDKAFFKKRQLLYMDAGDIEALTKRTKATIRQRKKEANPLFVSLGGSKKKKASGGDALELDRLQSKYSRELEHEGYKEYLTSDDGFALVVLVRFVESSTDLAATNALIERVRGLADELDPVTFHADMKVEFGGGLTKRQEQYKSIVDDILMSAAVTMLGVFFLLALYFRRARAVVVVLGPLIMSVIWTLGLAFAYYGELTVITAFIFAILLGLGIDFGIHVLSGYDDHRAHGAEPVDAMAACARGTGLATGVGALTTFATFVVLAFAQFKGMSQFGVVASAGVLLTLTSTMVTMPALVLLFQRWRPVEPRAVEETWTSRLLTNARLARVKRAGAPVATLAVVAVTAWAGWTARGLEFEENFRKIGQWSAPWEKESKVGKDLETRRYASVARDLALSVRAQAIEVREGIDPESYVPTREQKSIGNKYRSALQDRQSSMPTILLFDDPSRAAEVYANMSEALKDRPASPIRSATSIWGFMPGSMEEQRARAEKIEELREVVEDAPLKYLKEDERERVEGLKKQLDVAPFEVTDLPPWTKRLFREAGPGASTPYEGQEFAFDRSIYITSAVDSLNGPDTRAFMKEVRELSGADEREDFRIGSQAFIYISLLDSIQRDGPRMIAMAMLLVFVILVLALRHPGRALLAAVPLVLGAVWTAGGLVAFDIKLNFFNVVIIPALIGIGIDDGVHFYVRYMEGGKEALSGTLRHVGAAVCMTSATSMVGFGGLAITNYDGLTSLGQIALIAIPSTLVATVLALPALLTLAERLGIRWALPADARGEDEASS